ncbi:MAG: family 78 glycoside hydrolase catalytic domain [Clostridia bacterium]|nr:family 78 glycoside hydrolase catalytic domain [Clostridia bacterium]
MCKNEQAPLLLSFRLTKGEIFETTLQPGAESGMFALPDDALAAIGGEAQRRAAMEALCRAAKARGAETLTLFSPTDAVPFYESCGFMRCSVEYANNGKDGLRMAKDLVLDGIDWLTFDGAGETVLFRNDFAFPDGIECVTADILTHGFFECYLNGQRISDDLYVPAWTNYNQQDFSHLSYPNYDTYCYRSLFVRYDLTAAAKAGKNAFALHIGNGWYGQWESENEGNRPYGEKKLCFCITVRCKDGTTCEYSSNDGGVFRPGYITRTSMYFGETHDFRLLPADFLTCALDDAACKPVKTVERPYTLVRRQTCPPDRVLRRITDVTVLSKFGDRKIYDLGENVAGFAVLRFGKQARRGERVFVRYAENLNPDGSLNFHSTGGTNRLSVDLFRYGGEKENKERLLYPRFLWHAGRYVEVTGNADFVYFCVAASDVPVTAEFKSSDPLLNWLFDAYVRTQTANLHTCVPSDCPHRERLGYTGDGQLTAAAVMTVFDAKALYRKWMRDIADCQDIHNGHVPHTAPFYGGGGGPGGWGSAMVEVPYRYWTFYGDDGVLRTYYPHMKKYLDYLALRCDGHIVMREEPGGWCLGDWCTPYNSKHGIPIPEPFVNTYFYLRSLRQVMEIAPLAGAQADLPALQKTEQAVTAAFMARFFDEATGSFCGGVCGADAFALDLGLGDERTLQNLVTRYRELGTFDTGIFGTPLVVKVLFERGFGNDAYRLLVNDGAVSFRTMMNAGATTLWEEWFNENSSSHPMFGAVVEFLFKYLLGIRQPAGGAGYQTVEVRPCAVTDLDWAEGSMVLGGKRIRVRVEHGVPVTG